VLVPRTCPQIRIGKFFADRDGALGGCLGRLPIAGAQLPFDQWD
jgi:hypothetical protein